MEMRYVENPELNGKVAQLIEKLKEEIISRFRPKSIILTGSFGRGEATVVEENERLKFLSDCEIILIPYKWVFNRRKIEEFEENFYKRTGLKVEIWGFTPTLYLFLPLLSKRMKPTMANYDLKYGSKVIYGKDYLKKIPNFKPEDIPLWEGIRLLFNRMAEAIEYFSLGSPNEELIFWTDKIILACQDAFLLSLGKYHPSYRKRNELLRTFLPKFDDLNVQGLLDAATEATSRKLATKIDENINPTQYWFQVSEMCDKVFRWIIRKGLGIAFTDYLDFQEKYLKKQSGFISFYKNLIMYLKLLALHKFKNPLPLKSLKLRVPYTHLVYSIIPLIYFELCRKTEVSEVHLTCCLRVLSLFGVNCKLDPKECIRGIVNVWKYIR